MAKSYNTNNTKNSEQKEEKGFLENLISPDNNNKEKIDEEMKSSPLHQFFLDSLKDIYYAEHAMVDGLETMQDAATTTELREAFEEHQYQTKEQINRLERIFKLLGETPQKKECQAIKGLQKEVENIIKITEEGTMTRDAALIIAAQKIEHYEIASYGGLAQLAITMGHEKVANLLETTLEEEEETDFLLTDIAETHINLDAEHEK